MNYFDARSMNMCTSPSCFGIINLQINRLKAEGVIRRIGGDYGGCWEVTKS